MPGWPKDTSPNVIRRVNEWARLSPTQIQARMVQAQRDIDLAVMKVNLPVMKGNLARYIDGLISMITVWISSNPTTLEINEYIGRLSGSSKDDALRIFRVFVFAHRIAGEWANTLKNIPYPEIRREIFCFVNVYIKDKLNAQDFVESGLQTMVVNDPDNLRVLLTAALEQTMKIWSSLTTSRQKERFVKDVLDSPKGYSKTARSIDSWRPPKDVDFGMLVQNWLDGDSNQSVYNVNKTGDTKARSEWIRLGHSSAKQDEKDMMWLNFAMKLIEAADLSTEDVSDLKAYLKMNLAILILKFKGLVPSEELTQLVTVRIDLIWNTYLC